MKRRIHRELGLIQKFVDIKGRDVSYLFRNGFPTLVLIPGSHQDFRQYAEVVTYLDKCLGLIIVEIPGHGKSHVLPEDPSIERFAKDVMVVIRTCGLNQYYVGGHSIGGMISLEVGRRHPEGICGVISIEGWTDHRVAEEAFNGQKDMYCTLCPELQKKQQHLRRLATGHRTEEEKKLFSGLWTRWSGRQFLQTTKLPVLELWGDRGRPRPDLYKMHIPDRPNIFLKWFAKASHNLPLEYPAKVARAINNFINKKSKE